MGSSAYNVLSKKRDFVRETKKDMEMFRDMATK